MLINAEKEHKAIIEQLRSAMQVEKSSNAQLPDELRQMSADLADIKVLITGMQVPTGTTAQIAE